MARLGGRERVLPIGIAFLVLLASISGAAATGTVNGATGAPSAATAGPRLTIGGLDSSADQVDGPDQAGLQGGTGATTGDSTDLGQYLSDGTLLKPLAVDTTVSDASAKLITYTVKSGDTLTGIASKYGVSMMTLWWANNLAAKDELHIGQKLTIPPVDGLVIVVKAGDTLDSIAALTGMSADDIATYNSLSDRTLVIGQVLIVPGALGKPIVEATPKPVAKTTSGGGGSSQGTGPLHRRGLLLARARWLDQPVLLRRATRRSTSRRPRAPGSWPPRPAR